VPVTSDGKSREPSVTMSKEDDKEQTLSYDWSVSPVPVTSDGKSREPSVTRSEEDDKERTLSYMADRLDKIKDEETRAAKKARV